MCRILKRPVTEMDISVPYSLEAWPLVAALFWLAYMEINSKDLKLKRFYNFTEKRNILQTMSFASTCCSNKTNLLSVQERKNKSQKNDKTCLKNYSSLNIIDSWKKEKYKCWYI